MERRIEGREGDLGQGVISPTRANNEDHDNPIVQLLCPMSKGKSSAGSSDYSFVNKGSADFESLRPLC